MVEGLIGVGKTSLCRLLHQVWGAQLVLEPADDNPFLAAFYADPARYAFPTQMFYLATRLQQQVSLRQADLFHDLVVADYLFDKDRLFAEKTLAGPELALYDRFAGLLRHEVPTPDLVLFLDAPTDVIQERIGRRAIAAEQAIPRAYLDDLRRRYHDLWRSYTAAPVRVLDTTRLDYVNDAGDRAAVLALLQGWLASPGPSPTAATASSPDERQATAWPALFHTPGARD